MIKRNYNSKLRVAPKRKLNEAQEVPITYNQRDVLNAYIKAIKVMTGIQRHSSAKELKIRNSNFYLSVYNAIGFTKQLDTFGDESGVADWQIIIRLKFSPNNRKPVDVGDVDIRGSVILQNGINPMYSDIEIHNKHEFFSRKLIKHPLYPEEFDIETAATDIFSVIKNADIDILEEALIKSLRDEGFIPFNVNESRKPSTSKSYTVKLTESHVRVKNNRGRIILDVTGLRARSLFRESKGDATRLVKKLIN